jgi:hypothetical protein
MPYCKAFFSPHWGLKEYLEAAFSYVLCYRVDIFRKADAGSGLSAMETFCFDSRNAWKWRMRLSGFIWKRKTTRLLLKFSTRPWMPDADVNILIRPLVSMQSFRHRAGSI